MWGPYRRNNTRIQLDTTLAWPKFEVLLYTRVRDYRCNEIKLKQIVREINISKVAQEPRNELLTPERVKINGCFFRLISWEKNAYRAMRVRLFQYGDQRGIK